MLNEFSQKFSDRLFAAHPDWRQYLHASSGSVLDLTIPSPNPRLTAGLYIDTDGEITVGVDWYHTHFFGTPEEQAFECAIKLIDGLLSDQLVILAYFKDGEWTGSHCVGTAEPWPAPATGGCRLALSWSGRLDSEMLG